MDTGSPALPPALHLSSPDPANSVPFAPAWTGLLGGIPDSQWTQLLSGKT
jgi:hypothetical protein